MIIASIDPTISHELTFDLNISGSKEDPQDIRFIIDSQIDPDTGDNVQDVFSIICRATRSPDGVKVTVPRLLNLFRSGSYKSRLEVVLEGKLFTPLNEEIVILEPPKVEATSIKEVKSEQPEVSVTLSNIVAELMKSKEEIKEEQNIVEEEIIVISSPKPIEKIEPVDKSWRDKGFSGIKNPFKNQDKT